MPTEPPATDWDFPDPDLDPDLGLDPDDPTGGDLVAVGADLEPGSVLAAYRRGLFPMPVAAGVLGWWSPRLRGVIPIGGLVVSDSLRRSRRRYEIRVDTAFADVVAACADPARPGGWITPGIRRAYMELHDLGWAHSVEAWSLDDCCLAGGLYGVAIGGLFAGESMFHRRRDASKVALCGLVDILRVDPHPDRLLDCQWLTPHLGSLGGVEVTRHRYLRLLRRALAVPLPPAFA